jgi:hypothetical protein
MTNSPDIIIDPTLTAPLRSGELAAIAQEWGIDRAILWRPAELSANALGRAAGFDPAKWNGWQYEAIVGPKRPG